MGKQIESLHIIDLSYTLANINTLNTHAVKRIYLAFSIQSSQNFVTRESYPGLSFPEEHKKMYTGAREVSIEHKMETLSFHAKYWLISTKLEG